MEYFLKVCFQINLETANSQTLSSIVEDENGEQGHENEGEDGQERTAIQEQGATDVQEERSLVLD